VSPGRALPAGEAKRKSVHMGMAAFALLLPFLTWWQAAVGAVAAFAFNWQGLPRLLGHRLTSARADVSDRGVLLYPVVVLGMILVFRHDLAFAAVGWGFLAFGDGLAGVVGMKWGRHPLPWHERKTWEGLAGGVLGAFAGATLLFLFTVTRGLSRRPWGEGAVAPPVLWLACGVLLGAIVYALVESAPLAVNDNLLAPALGSLAVWAMVAPWTVSALANPPWPAWQTEAAGWLLAAAVNSLCAVLAAWKRVLTPAGIAGALLLGLVTWGFGGLFLWLVLVAFLGLGTAVTRIGWERKAALGIAEGNAGRRGLGNVAAKGAVVFAAALLTPFGFAPLLATIAVAALAAALADTAGSEVGKAYGGRAWALFGMRAVAPGTAGAVSVAGTAASAVGALIVALAALQLRVVDAAGAVLCGAVGFGAALLEGGLSRRVGHDAVNLTLTLIAATLAGALFVLIGW
jgi:uncharacterized protein (TIGR00297 family)